MTRVETAAPTGAGEGFVRGLGMFDSVMMVVGIVIGSGIFIVSADMARKIGSSGGLLVAWAITGVLTIAASLSYGELASMFPRAGGMYVYLTESFSPMWGFLYGWTLFGVIQTGTIAAVAVAFARFSGVIWPSVSEQTYLIAPIHITSGYALSLSTAQLLAIAVIILLTWTNCRGLEYGKIVQNSFTATKILALGGLIVVGLFFGWNAQAVRENFGHLWRVSGQVPLSAGLDAATVFGLLVALSIAQSGSLFAADAWHDVTFAADEVRDPRRTLARALAIGSVVVIVLYMLANVAYLAVLPLHALQNAPDDRVATAMLQAVFPGLGTALMAILIMISTFGCINGLVLAGARAYYAMARDRLFFPRAGRLNRARVPGWALAAQGVWAAFLVLPRTFDPATHTYGNLYSNLLDYIISSALIFYVLTIAGLFRLRRKRPDAERPFRVPGYPVVPGLYIAGGSIVLVLLFIYRPATTWPGLVITMLGLPVYLVLRKEHVAQ
ncbi:MAG TPA: amino acid permease [Patescibacteria group bacterium]|nr:amino acid permease [Patescibacteria group bacterium]